MVERISDRGTTRLLIDTTPDLREQALRAGMGWVDGVIFTHDHADHIHGIDDLRGFFITSRKRVDIYADTRTLNRLYQAFSYCFRSPQGSDYPPIATAHEINHLEIFTVDGAGGPIPILPVPQIHGTMTSLGFRIGGLAYSPDVSDLEPPAIAAYSDLDIWILDALRPAPHPSHWSLTEACDWAQRLAPKRAVLTHMHIDLDYDNLCQSLPQTIQPAYDGMVMELPVDGIQT